MEINQEVIELELAFNAFSRIVIDRLLAIAPDEGQAIERALRVQAQKFYSEEHGQAALSLETLADFAVQREVQQSLLAIDTTSPPQ